MLPISIELPDNFLEEELRCDFLVSKEMKKLWAVEIDLLMKLDSVCKRYGLKYYVTYGSLIGVIRHKGFIPWDDDIDVNMFREDYEKLCEVAEKEFTEPYFFQTEYTDPGTLRGHAQVRNSKTTVILNSEKGKYKFNQGAFIDIFVMDAVPEDKEDFEKQKKQVEGYKKKSKRIARWSTRYRRTKGIKGNIKAVLYPISNFILRRIKLEEKYYRKMEKASMRYNNQNTEMVGIMCFSYEKGGASWLRREYFDDIIYKEFEFVEVPVPVRYHEMLTADYGDYMKFVRGTSYHGNVLVDTEKSYTEYIK